MVSNRAVLSVGLFSSVLVAICAISSGSLWVDELGTWLLTRADSISDWWRRLQSWPDSDSLIPLYHFYMYLWTKLIGTDAVAMRASNVGMFVIANLALLWPFRSQSIVAFAIILTSCLNSSIWYYLNEIRPYIMLYMGTCLMVGATIEIMGSQRKPDSLGVKALCVGAILSSGATAVGIVWVGSTFLFILIYWLAIKKEPLRDLINENYFTLGITALFVTALIAHDIRMFALGKLPAPGESNILTFLFSFYTDLGLFGVGPGTLDIRANGIGALAPFAVIIALSGMLLSLVAIGGLSEIKILLGIRAIVIIIGCALLPVLFTFALGWFVHWRVLPRHLIPLVSLFSLLYAFGFVWWWRRQFPGRAITLFSVAIMAYSSFNVRLAPRYAKDDYKHAAELAAIELAHDGRVWWVADYRAALYYGIPYVSDEPGWPQPGYNRGVELFVGQKTLSHLSAQEPPTLVLFSRPESYDKHSVVSDYLSLNGYRLVESFPAFAAWRR